MHKIARIYFRSLVFFESYSKNLYRYRKVHKLLLRRLCLCFVFMFMILFMFWFYVLMFLCFVSVFCFVFMFFCVCMLSLIYEFMLISFPYFNFDVHIHISSCYNIYSDVTYLLSQKTYCCRFTNVSVCGSVNVSTL